MEIWPYSRYPDGRRAGKFGPLDDGEAKREENGSGGPAAAGKLGTRGTPELRAEERKGCDIWAGWPEENLGMADGFFRNETKRISAADPGYPEVSHGDCAGPKRWMTGILTMDVRGTDHGVLFLAGWGSVATEDEEASSQSTGVQICRFISSRPRLLILSRSI